MGLRRRSKATSKEFSTINIIEEKDHNFGGAPAPAPVPEPASPSLSSSEEEEKGSDKEKEEENEGESATVAATTEAEAERAVSNEETEQNFANHEVTVAPVGDADDLSNIAIISDSDEEGLGST